MFLTLFFRNKQVQYIFEGFKQAALVGKELINSIEIIFLRDNQVRQKGIVH